MKKGPYVKGTCGRCGKTGHNAWHCPDRQSKKKASSTKKKAIVNQEQPERKQKHDPGMIREIAGKGISAQAAADELGVSVAMWYYLKKKHASDVLRPNTEFAARDPKAIMTSDDIREKVVELQNEGLTSIVIAARLKVPLKQVNRYWQKDALAPAGDGDLPDREDEEADDLI